MLRTASAALALSAALLSGCHPKSATVTQSRDLYAADWAVDPKSPGPDLPPAGQSLFDRLVPDPVPYPLTDLIARVETRLGAKFDRVLIPLGRSLQRSAGAPEFFRYPRAVLAMTTEPESRAGIYAKDRLFLGYQEKASIIEVISYNDAAGRFEFQLVKNYGPGKTPQVYYARREVCTVCHQNHAPLFPRQLWDETNANPKVSRLLSQVSETFYGIAASQSADVPYRIDSAVHRANQFSVAQTAWREAGSDTLRAALLRAAVLYRLADSRDFDWKDSAAPLEARWRERWPRGIRLPNPEISNRNPLAVLSRGGPSADAEVVAFLTEKQKHIDNEFEPAVPRPPLEVWQADDATVERVAAALGRLLGDEDVRQIDQKLATLPADRLEYRVDGIEGRLATGGVVDRLWSPAGQLRALDVIRRAGPTLTLGRASSGLHARFPNGDRIDHVLLQPSGSVLVLRRESQALKRALPPLPANSFNPAAVRQVLFTALGITQHPAPNEPTPLRTPRPETK
jgi:hypothetical protein